MPEFSDKIDDFDPKVFGFDVAVPGSDKTMVCMEVEALRGICARVAELEAERAESQARALEDAGESICEHFREKRLDMTLALVVREGLYQRAKLIREEG